MILCEEIGKHSIFIFFIFFVLTNVTSHILFSQPNIFRNILVSPKAGLGDDNSCKLNASDTLLGVRRKIKMSIVMVVMVIIMMMFNLLHSAVHLKAWFIL